jgi:hypothetical protein
MAGSRLPYLDARIPFSYDDLVNAIARAIERQQELDGACVVDTVATTVEEKLDYTQLKEEALSLWKKLVGEGENTNAEMASRILKRVEMIFGRPMRLSEITEDQTDLYNLVLIDMRELASEQN